MGGRLHFAGDRLEQCVHTQTASCRDRIDRHAQPLAQLVAVDMNILRLNVVDEVERDDHGQTQTDQLHGQVQVTFQIGCVHDVQNTVQLVGQHELACDDLLLGVGRERIDTGQVDHIGALALIVDVTGFSIDCDTGPVANVLVGTGQTVEQGGLAAVRVADDCKCMHGLTLQFDFGGFVPPQ